MNKQEVIKRLKAGSIQIENDNMDVELLSELIGYKIAGITKYYTLNRNSYNTLDSLQIIKLSEITEDEVWKSEEIEYSRDGITWRSCEQNFYRIKPEPNYDTEIKLIQDKAKENGMKAIISFEKI